jgi:tetratricopeptide (TPR) repeat protein
MFRKPTERRRPQLLTIAAIGLFMAPFLWGEGAAAQSKSPSLLSTAKLQLDRGDLESCEQTLWNVLSVQPANENALLMLATVRARQQRYGEAEALYRRVLQFNPKSIAASRGLAASLVAQNKPDEAIRQYEAAIQLLPQDSDLKIEAAQLDLAQGNFAEALSILNTIKPNRLPSSAIPLKAASLLALGRRSDAEQLLPLIKGSPGAALALAQVFVEGKDSDAALRALAFVNPVPKAAASRVDYLKGRALREQGDLPAATSSFRQALMTDPKSVDALVAISEIFAVQNKHAESVETLEKARALSPDSPAVLRHIIVEAMEAGQNDEALEAAQHLQSKSSELSDRYLVATVMIQQKQYLPATYLLEDYVAQRPEDARAFLGLGMAYLNLLRYADAQKALEHSLQLQPNLAEAEYQLGLVFAQLGNRQEAAQAWEKAVELQPHHALALFSLGTMYLEAGELEKAQSAFARSLAEDPKNMKTEYDLALVLNKLGKSDEAKQHFERYRKMQEEEHSTNGNAPEAAGHP